MNQPLLLDLNGRNKVFSEQWLSDLKIRKNKKLQIFNVNCVETIDFSAFCRIYIISFFVFLKNSESGKKSVLWNNYFKAS